MRQIPLRTVEAQVRGQDAPVTVDYAELLYRALMFSARGGHSLQEIRERMPVLDRVEKAIEEKAEWVRLEDAQHQVVVRALAVYPFGLVHAAIVAFADAVEGAPEVEPA